MTADKGKRIPVRLPAAHSLSSRLRRAPGSKLSARMSFVTLEWRRRASSDNGTMVGVKEPREVVLAPLAVPMSLGAAGRVRL